MTSDTQTPQIIMPDVIMIVIVLHSIRSNAIRYAMPCSLKAVVQHHVAAINIPTSQPHRWNQHMKKKVPACHAIPATSTRYNAAKTPGLRDDAGTLLFSIISDVHATNAPPALMIPARLPRSQTYSEAHSKHERPSYWMPSHYASSRSGVSMPLLAWFVSTLFMCMCVCVS
jgi:hypothetical protein